jgi:LCP family protein required for cell wall assembly
VSASDSPEGHARPIPQSGGPSRAADEAPAYVVDTRRKVSFARSTPQPPPTPRPPGASRPAPRTRTGPVADGTGPVAGRSVGGAAYRPVRPPRPGRARLILRRTVALVIVSALAAGGYLAWVPFNAWRGVERVDNTPPTSPPDTAGRNYLLVGSDSREGLTPAQQAELATGPDDGGGKRTDSIMLVHVSDHGGKPVIVSIPRDSYVPIPGKGSSNKINAAFAFGGARLLTETVEQATGLHIDGYLEIGFGGFARIVDSLGGVDICVTRDMKDELAGINLKAGCQTLDGKNALGYVRSRHNDPRGDLGRAERQRQFLGAVMKKAANPATVLVPTRYSAFADAVSAGLAVGSQTSLGDAIAIAQALRAVGNGDGLSLQVPIETASLQTKNAGVAVKWHPAQAKALFSSLLKDESLTAPPPGTDP